MTIQNIIDWFGENPNIILAYFSALLIICLMGLLFSNSLVFKPPINYIYTVLIYAVSVPGLLALILVLYSLFINKANLLEVNMLAYFLPIGATIVNIIIIKKTVRLDRIPGFDKLSGMFLLIVVTFVVTYILQRLFFGVIFIGSFIHLVVLFVILLVALRYAWKKILG
ncbi:hypothetical protein MHTCC0001_35030 [Flavobacteriaceae bacterium MHTCC 0001]